MAKVSLMALCLQSMTPPSIRAQESGSMARRSRISSNCGSSHSGRW